MQFIIALCLTFITGIWAATPTSSTIPKTFKVQSVKETYPLSWDMLYRVNVCNAYSTVIEPPQGFTLDDIILGDSKLFKAEKSDNRAIVKRLAPDSASTNLVLILSGPDKVSKSLTFELTGFDAPRISNVQFMMPEEVGRIPALEKAKYFYSEQLQLSLMDQEKRLNNSIQARTMEWMDPFQIEEPETVKKLGARVSLEGIANSGGKGYVYVFTNAKDPDYQVVRLTGIQSKDLAKTVTLFSTRKFEDGTRYIYATTPFVKCDEGKKYSFFFQIYQEHAELTAKVK